MGKICENSKMVVMFEIAKPFRWKPKAERAGPLRRWIWAYFSVAYIGAGFNDVAGAIRADERERLAAKSGQTVPTARSTPAR